VTPWPTTVTTSHRSGVADDWGHGDLTAATGAPGAAGDPSGYVFDAQGTQHVNYRSRDGHVHELWWGAQGGWAHGDLTSQHVIYRGSDGSPTLPPISR
jgi:hypothetical protein